MGYENAMIMFYCVQEAVRMNVDDMKIMEILSHSGLKLNSYKARNKAMEMVKRFGDQVRKWDYRGHTAIEWNHLKNESQQGKEQFRKIVPFSSGKKVYPNDLCPCGSGKKYKHCCGKQDISVSCHWRGRKCSINPALKGKINCTENKPFCGKSSKMKEEILNQKKSENIQYKIKKFDIVGLQYEG